ncbi:MAG: hypothetical protein LC650_02480 [Actinobacteria bacterium]|nr:hypothetical protein [Actinomycetota bacterium]
MVDTQYGKVYVHVGTGDIDLQNGHQYDIYGNVWDEANGTPKPGLLYPIRRIGALEADEVERIETAVQQAVEKIVQENILLIEEHTYG